MNNTTKTRARQLKIIRRVGGTKCATRLAFGGLAVAAFGYFLASGMVALGKADKVSIHTSVRGPGVSIKQEILYERGKGDGE